MSIQDFLNLQASDLRVFRNSFKIIASEVLLTSFPYIAVQFVFQLQFEFQRCQFKIVYLLNIT